MRFPLWPTSKKNSVIIKIEKKKNKTSFKEELFHPSRILTILYNLRNVRSRYNCLSNTWKEVTQAWLNIILYINLETISFVACILQFDYNFISIECAVPFKFYPITDNSRVIYKVHDFCLNQLKIYAYQKIVAFPFLPGTSWVDPMKGSL